MARDRPELAAFLRARRDAITPAEAGIEAFPGARRVPGLRRDELAFLSGLSPDYYSRIEQGRQGNISDEVLDALARALRLDAIETSHLHDLADPDIGPADAASESAQAPDAGLARVMGALGDVPVLLLGRRTEVLAANSLARAVLGAPLRPGERFAEYLLLDPTARRRIVNWSYFGRAAVGALRREAARHPADAALADLIAELRRQGPEVETWWIDHGVEDYASAPKRIDHPTAGELVFDVEIVASPLDLDQRLVIYVPEPGSPTAEALVDLADGSGAFDLDSTPAPPLQARS